MSKHLISNQVIFDSVSHQLFNSLDASLQTTLGATASRCLFVLIENNGKIVTKRELLYEAWEKYGSIVTGNSVSQAITQIRRALSIINIREDIINTTPRIGYSIACPIQLLDSGSINFYPPSDILMPEPQSLHAGIWDVVPVEENKKKYKEIKKIKWVNLLILCSLTCFSSLIARLTYMGTWGNVTNSFETIRYKKVEGNPKIFMSSTASDGHAIALDYIDQLKEYPPTTIADLKNKLIYINNNKLLEKDFYSYLVCDKAIGEVSAECAIYILKKEG
ncbi:winged helix-turn-helix domain-containing protein [Chromobacterium haemolyticum]|uniref:winged helix-turn-helix domain-containing protein n=1 Tax=Chromobacterium haemolyticum TaxID=394935 RepID=UPI0009D9688F|nr:winged helix-turn-helix domain-containing protein [Chromobacterium haemolyticum]OQS36564.1 hypothetical protein B0T39_16210 [Chromobacterium haemolyticum]